MPPDQFDRATLRIMDGFSETLASAVADALVGIGSLKDKAGAEGDWPVNYQSCADELKSNLEAQVANLTAEALRLKAFATIALQPSEA